MLHPAFFLNRSLHCRVEPDGCCLHCDVLGGSAARRSMFSDSSLIAIFTLRGFACSLDIDTSEQHPSKRRRVRHQHFWRNSDKLPPDHRLYVASADIKQALEEVR